MLTLNRYRSIFSVCCFAFAVFVSDGKAEETLDVSREKIIPIDLVVVSLGTPYRSKPYSNNSAGTVWSQKVGHDTEVDGVRVHLRVKDLGSAPFEIRVSDMNGIEEIERISSDSSLVRDGSFWTAVVPGRKAKIELITTDDPNSVDITIDSYAYTITNAKPEATVGPDDKIAISQASPEIRALAPPIARLVIMLPEGGAYCTGFLLTKNLILTNQHCIQNETEARSTVVEFKYENPSPKPKQFHVQRLETSDIALDYALLRTDLYPGNDFGFVEIDSAQALTEDMDLVIIQHPAGLPKMAAVKDCNVDGIVKIGVIRNGTDFGHICDTLGGSSGSPIFSSISRKVVGLHHLGFREGIDDPINQGVYIAQVLADIRVRKPEIYREILDAQL